MTKLLKVLLCGLIAVSLLAGCSNKTDDNTNNNTNDQVTENTPTDAPENNGTETSESISATLLATFNETMSATPDASALDIANAIVANPAIPFGPVTMEVEEGLLNGFSNAEITGFESAATFAPMIGTIPFMGYIFQLGADADVDAFVTMLKENANLAWNICTEADELTVEASGNTIFFLMSPLSFEE